MYIKKCFMLILCLLGLEQAVMSSAPIYLKVQQLSSKLFNADNALSDNNKDVLPLCVIAGAVTAFLVGSFVYDSTKYAKARFDIAQVCKKHQKFIEESLENIQNLEGLVTFVTTQQERLNQINKDFKHVQSVIFGVHFQFDFWRDKERQYYFKSILESNQDVDRLSEVLKYREIIKLYADAKSPADLVNSIEKYYRYFSEYPLVTCVGELRYKLQYLPNEKCYQCFEQILKDIIAAVVSSAEYKSQLIESRK